MSNLIDNSGASNSNNNSIWSTLGRKLLQHAFPISIAMNILSAALLVQMLYSLIKSLAIIHGIVVVDSYTSYTMQSVVTQLNAIITPNSPAQVTNNTTATTIPH